MTGMPPRRPQCQTPPYQEEAGKSRSWGEERRHPTSCPSPSVHSSRPGQPGPAQRRVTLQLTTPICWGVKEGRLQRGQGPSPRAFCPRPTQGGSLPRGPPPRGQPRPPAPRASCPGFRSSDTETAVASALPRLRALASDCRQQRCLVTRQCGPPHPACCWGRSPGGEGPAGPPASRGHSLALHAQRGAPPQAGP